MHASDEILRSQDPGVISKWIGSLRPTHDVVGVEARTLPLRVIDCRATLQQQKLKFVRPISWDFGIVSHHWSRIGEKTWSAGQRPWPARGEMQVTAATKEAVFFLVEYCLIGRADRAIDFLWIDCACIDQSSTLEKAREIAQMGSYYERANVCIICPWGIDNMGPPTDIDGALPPWHFRAWTLQESVLSNDKAEYLFWLPESIASDRNAYQSWETRYFLDEEGQTSRDQEIPTVPTSALKHESSLTAELKGTCRDYPLYCVPAHAYTQALRSWIHDRLFDPLSHMHGKRRERESETMKKSLTERTWTMVNVLREMFDRDAHFSEDLIYGCLGLLGVQPLKITYGIHLRGALLSLAEAMHVDQRLLLTVVESYHGEWIDGYSTLPAFRELGAKRAPRVDIHRLLGQANFRGHQGMEITAPVCIGRTMTRISFKESILVDPIGKDASMFLCEIRQDLETSDTRPIQSNALCSIAPTSAEFFEASFTLIAVATCRLYTVVRLGSDKPIPDSVTDLKSRGHVSFLCLFCRHRGSVMQKVGLAVVKASCHQWSIQRTLVA